MTMRIANTRSRARGTCPDDSIRQVDAGSVHRMADTSSSDQNRHEVRSGLRFAFGRNWQRFLRVVDEGRIADSRQALLSTLGAEDLAGRAFLDAGCGSGLSALAALRSGARVTAFDFDPDAVAATKELLERWAPHGSEWKVLQGSVLDRAFVGSLGPHDIVHSWGVLHHTGSMWEACDVIAEAVPPGGTLFIALYNDAGPKSVAWARRKRRYVALPAGLRSLYAWALLVAAEMLFLARSLAKGRPREWWRQWRGGGRPGRGMSRYRDWIDWVGGFPYEYATVDEVLERFEPRGFRARNIRPNGGTGCNEFVLIRENA